MTCRFTAGKNRYIIKELPKFNFDPSVPFGSEQSGGGAGNQRKAVDPKEENAAIVSVEAERRNYGGKKQ